MEQIDKYVNLVSEKTGQSEKIVKNGGLALIVIVFVFGFGASIVANFIGVMYPAFQSFKALESPNSDDDKKWLTYWLVFSAFSIMDHFAAMVLTYVPFYYIFKLCFLVYLFHPMTDGAVVIYSRYLYPTYKKYEKNIDNLKDQYNDATKFSKKD